MILKGAEAARYCAKPDPNRAGLLIFSADPMRVALKRQEAIAALIGPQGEGEMRLSRIAASDLRKDASLLLDAIKEIGFFPGPRVAFVEDATEGLTEVIGLALRDWQPGDANIIVTAGSLTAKNSLKGLFEKAPNAICIGLYDEPPSRDEIEAELAKAGLRRISQDAMADLTTLARALDPGDFRQTLEKIALYKHGDEGELTPAEVAAMAPATIDAEVDELIRAAAEGRSRDLGLLMRRLEGQGLLPVTICIGALRHFRSLHIAMTDPGGLQSGLMRARVFGPRRDQMQAQARGWALPVLEAAITDLLDADLTLRSSSRAPGMALMERSLLRIAHRRRA
ncbi:DNA polymerase III subunit delta [Xinfangfangia sp. CPCC 101601]|uniref:DNA-directed DNA polymerase n=1 Tax=Pseudogemmobacter lacusdianii TaxID=3069608 RepID=A0ABU0VZM3_9RHOB|nr:DNA polymerase III subunit delta [Xinfangfangia sp. CPCC 101601]MDQ2066345.1 DNA polymerase III subunit delta [Xinfangfangia sp. CPCC 101601]